MLGQSLQQNGDETGRVEAMNEQLDDVSAVSGERRRIAGD